jgi:hypothetical protein
MVYGSEAILPTELQYGSPKVQAYQPIEDEQVRQDTVDLLKESRDIIVARLVGYQQTLWWYHARKVHPRAFQVGDLVLRRVQTKKCKHTLSPPWEGPYLVAKVIRPRHIDSKSRQCDLP